MYFGKLSVPAPHDGINIIVQHFGYYITDSTLITVKKYKYAKLSQPVANFTKYQTVNLILCHHCCISLLIFAALFYLLLSLGGEPASCPALCTN